MPLVLAVLGDQVLYINVCFWCSNASSWASHEAQVVHSDERKTHTNNHVSVDLAFCLFCPMAGSWGGTKQSD